MAHTTLPQTSGRVRTTAARRSAWIVAVAVAARAASAVFGQGIHVSTPMTHVGDSFYERSGVGFGFSWGGSRAGGGSAAQFFGGFNQNSAGSAVPPFGGYDPAADAVFGFSRQSDSGSFSLGFRLGKGSSRTLTSVTPSVVVPNGGIGSIFSGTLTPFVTGVVPVVGGGEPLLNAPRSRPDVFASATAPERAATSAPPADWSRPNSTAERGDESVAEIRSHQAAARAADSRRLQQTIDEARCFEETGDRPRAIARYRQAVRLATGRQRYELQRKLESLEGPRD